MPPLLTIAIPTYNRAAYLDKCLHSFCNQIVGKFEASVELIISDNCSPDETENVVAAYVEKFSFVKYFKQETNIGADANFEWCFSNAAGSYLWIFGDDDVLLPQKFVPIIEAIEKFAPALISVSGYGYQSDHLAERPNIKPILNKKQVEVIAERKVFLKKVHYGITFCSGNIFSKDLLGRELDSKKFIGTNLNHIQFILKSWLGGSKFLIMNDWVMAVKTNNTGGYKLYETFVSNFNSILISLEKDGMPVYVRKLINSNMLLSFFPQFIIAGRKGGTKAFQKESPLSVMRTHYGRVMAFWIFDYPLFVFPLAFAEAYNRIILRNLNRLKNALL